MLSLLKKLLRLASRVIRGLRMSVFSNHPIIWGVTLIIPTSRLYAVFATLALIFLSMIVILQTLLITVISVRRTRSITLRQNSRLLAILVVVDKTCAIVLELARNVYARLVEPFTPTNHIEAHIDATEFENTFKDSGYWDYFLLSTYDNWFRLHMVYSLIFVSDYSIVEKASWRGVGALLWPLNQILFMELKTLSEFFLHACVWFVTIFFSIWAIVVISACLV